MKPKNEVKAALVILGVIAPLCAHASDSFQPILLPDSTYLSGTTRISITSYMPPLFDGTLNIGFAVGGNYFPPISATTFASWSSPPYSESSNPGSVYYYADIYIPGRSLYLTFSKPLQTFGVEIQIEAWDATSPITATFYDGTTPLGSISQTIGGWEGARLFAAHTDTRHFDSVVIYDPSSPTGFGIGQFRYTAVPEPPVISLLALGIFGAMCVRRHYSRLSHLRSYAQPLIPHSANQISSQRQWTTP